MIQKPEQFAVHYAEAFQEHNVVESYVPGSYLALVSSDTQPAFWDTLGDLMERYRTDSKDHSYDMLTGLVQHGLFRKAGEKKTAPLSFVQSVDDYIESYHSRPGFSRERMGQEQAVAFDQEARTLLLQSYPDGQIPLQVAGHVIWGLPAPY